MVAMNYYLSNNNFCTGRAGYNLISAKHIIKPLMPSFMNSKHNLSQWKIFPRVYTCIESDSIKVTICTSFMKVAKSHFIKQCNCFFR